MIEKNLLVYKINAPHQLSDKVLIVNGEMTSPREKISVGRTVSQLESVENRYTMV